MSITAPLDHELRCWEHGQLLLGVDEVGRGPLAGPVIAAAVVLPRGHAGIPGLRDSKKVTSRRRRGELADAVRQTALAWALGAATVAEIDELNIRRATALAMRRAIAKCRRRLGDRSEEIGILLVDGTAVPELGEPHQPLVKGDAACHTIAAAAMIAKVARDRLMERLDLLHPAYRWGSNAGYGTADHLAGLRRHGLTVHHRRLFCATAVGATPFDRG